MELFRRSSSPVDEAVYALSLAADAQSPHARKRALAAIREARQHLGRVCRTPEPVGAATVNRSSARVDRLERSLSAAEYRLSKENQQ